MNSGIYEGWVEHHRRLPRQHRFRYRIFLMYLDLAELPALFKKRWLWSASRPAIAWFRRRDHFGDPTLPLDEAVRELVKRETGTRPRGPIRLLTHLRYFGYCMNPVSFFYCFDEDDRTLEFVVAEINNTPWGERHCYVLDCRCRQTVRGRFRFEFDKQFHVSPFMPMDQRYRWTLWKPGQDLGVHMENRADAKRQFTATMRLERRELSGVALARVLVRYPLMTARVVFAIYWQALALWIKGASFYPHPKTFHPKEAKR